MNITPISRTIGYSQIVDEMIISFDHNSNIDWLLPGCAPTNKTIKFPLLAVVGFEQEGGEWKVASERIYWDQATVLLQAGILTQSSLPITGSEQAELVLDINSHATNKLLK